MCFIEKVTILWVVSGMLSREGKHRTKVASISHRECYYIWWCNLRLREPVHFKDAVLLFVVV